MRETPNTSLSAMATMPVVLESLDIASPCEADWNEMTGDNQVRFCGLCQLNVYNLSGMTRGEAESLLQAKEGKMCIRMLRRTDGTVLTQDCPVGVRAKYKRRIKVAGWGVTAAAVTLIAIYGTFTPVSLAETKGDRAFVEEPPAAKMGEMVAPPPKGTTPTPPQIQMQPKHPTPPSHTMGKPMMGNPVVPPEGKKPDGSQKKSK